MPPQNATNRYVNVGSTQQNYILCFCLNAALISSPIYTLPLPCNISSGYDFIHYPVIKSHYLIKQLTSIVNRFIKSDKKNTPASSVFFDGKILQFIFYGGCLRILYLEARLSSLKILSTYYCLFFSSFVKFTLSLMFVNKAQFQLVELDIQLVCVASYSQFSTPHLIKPCRYCVRKSVATACYYSIITLVFTSSFIFHLNTLEVASSIVPVSLQKKLEFIILTCISDQLCTVCNTCICQASHSDTSPLIPMLINQY